MDSGASKLEADRQLLREAQAKGGLSVWGAYLKLSGPGWLQSALTLGGGSLASSLYLGVLGGVSLLWLQPFAMILGIVMLSAIGYVALSTGRPAFRAVHDHVNPVLAWAWALASMAANMVWAMPQYALAVGVLQQNLVPGALQGTAGKAAWSALILVACTLVTWAYDRGGRGVRVYEWTLKIVVAFIVACFVGVVVKLAAAGDVLREALAGFVPSLSRFHEPAPAFAPLLAAVSEEARAWWSRLIVAEQRDVMIAAAATAVGINMTFLFPYSLLKRGWGKDFRGLVRFDLSTGMFIPFVLATSCVVVAAANRFHATPDAGLAAGAGTAKMVQGYEKLLKSRLQATGAGSSGLDRAGLEAKLEPGERTLAAALVSRDAFDLAKALDPLMGPFFANVVFGLGVLGMTLSTITLLMLVSGFIFCEIFGFKQGGWPHRLGCLFAATGALGPFIWSGAAFYLAVPTSVFGFMLIPIAYITFFFLMNQRSLLGDDLPKGGSRVAWNLLMGTAVLITTSASVVTVWQKTQWKGVAAVAALGLAALVAHVVRKPKPVGGPTS